jgi:hypothetical protein
MAQRLFAGSKDGEAWISKSKKTGTGKLLHWIFDNKKHYASFLNFMRVMTIQLYH